MITENSKIRRVEEARQYTTIAWILIRQCQTFCRNASHKRARGGQHLTGDLAFLLAVAFARQCHAYALRGSAAPWPKRQVLLPARRGSPMTSPAEPGVPVVPAWFQGAGRSRSPQREKPTCKFRSHGGSPRCTSADTRARACTRMRWARCIDVGTYCAARSGEVV